MKQSNLSEEKLLSVTIFNLNNSMKTGILSALLAVVTISAQAATLSAPQDDGIFPGNLNYRASATIAFVNPPADVTVDCGSIPAAPALDVTTTCSGDVTRSYKEVNNVTEGCGIILRTWTAIDACSDTIRHTQIITVFDHTPPVLSGVPNGGRVSCSIIPAPKVVTATDNCDPSIEVIFSETSAITNGYRTITRVWSATDNCGNTASDKQILIVYDDVAPFLSGVPSDTVVHCIGDVPPVPAVTATSNCSSPESITVAFNESVTPGSCPDNMTITRTWTASDKYSNTRTYKQVITVIDNVLPVLKGVPNGGRVSCSNIPAPRTVTATDNCDPSPDVVFTEVNEVINGCSKITRFWRATDNCGNTVSDKQILQVYDATVPVISGIPANLSVSCAADVPAVPVVTVSDNCTPKDLIVLKFEENTSPGNCPNSFVITRKWTATDYCGNTATGTQTITVADTVSPVVTAGSPVYNISACESFVLPMATALDNCSGTTQVIALINGQPVNLSEYIFPTGETTVVFEATDACGNTGIATVLVTRAEPPSVTVVPPDLDPVCGEFDSNKLTTTSSGDIAEYTWTVDGEGWSITGNANSSEVYYRASTTQALFTVIATDKYGCSASDTYLMKPCQANNHCTYTQGFYGNDTGKGCAFIDGEYIMTDALTMMKAVVPLQGKEIFGIEPKDRKCDGKYFVLRGEEVNNGFILKMLPGVNGPAAFKGPATSYEPKTWPNVPMDNNMTGKFYGRIENMLFSQVLTMYFNKMNDKNLKDLELGRIMTSAKAEGCGSIMAVSNTARYVEIPQNIIDFLGSSATVSGLYYLANQALGGIKYGDAPLSDITEALDAVNNLFDGCRIFTGSFESYDAMSKYFYAAPVTENEDSGSDIAGNNGTCQSTDSDIEMKVYPNPFSENLFFNILMKKDSHVRLEIFNQYGVSVRILLDEDLKENDSMVITLDGATLRQSVYFYKIVTDSGYSSGSVTRIK